MKKLILLLMIQSFVPGFMINAQKITVKKGSLDFISEQRKILVTFDYSNMSVGSYEKEEDYVNEKVAENNAVEPGKGDKWKEAWESNKKNRYEPKFIELLNYYTLRKDLLCGKDAKDAKYVMVVHTLHMDLGKDSYIDVEITFRKISDNEAAAVISFTNCRGESPSTFGGYTVAMRIEGAYERLGRALAGMILKKL